MVGKHYRLIRTPTHYTQVYQYISSMDSTPGLEVYESYEADYKTLAASIGSKLKGEARETKGGG